jgi:hypothetical protein
MYDVRFVAWPAFVHPASPQSHSATRSLILVRTTATASRSGCLARGHLASIRKRLGRHRPLENLRYARQAWRACSSAWLGIVVAGRRGMGAGRTTGAGGVGASTGVWTDACKGWSYICESGRGGTLRFALGFGFSSSSSEPVRVQVPHGSLSPHHLRIWDRADVRGW